MQFRARLTPPENSWLRIWAKTLRRKMSAFPRGPADSHQGSFVAGWHCTAWQMRSKIFMFIVRDPSELEKLKCFLVATVIQTELSKNAMFLIYIGLDRNIYCRCYWPRRGVMTASRSVIRCTIISDIRSHSYPAITSRASQSVARKIFHFKKVNKSYHAARVSLWIALV